MDNPSDIHSRRRRVRPDVRVWYGVLSPYACDRVWCAFRREVTHPACLANFCMRKEVDILEGCGKDQRMSSACEEAASDCTAEDLFAMIGAHSPTHWYLFCCAHTHTPRFA